ncbi:deleted in malignant brain tumors 1 protein [Biomphalaria glabrata]|nr:deleted in malignant brain tumors 1 protein [Biomphalaria glabrata]
MLKVLFLVLSSLLIWSSGRVLDSREVSSRQTVVHTLDLELHMWSCAYDHLCINGVRFCGNWASGSVFQYILPAYKEFTLDLKTDQIVNARGFDYTTNNPWYYDSTSYYQYTTNYPWYYDSTSYYQYSTGYPYYYESTTYDPYSTNDPWYEASTYSPYTTGNPYYNPYTPVGSAFPSKDYVASLVQQVIQQLNSERYSQEQASLLLAQLLRYLRY